MPSILSCFFLIVGDGKALLNKTEWNLVVQKATDKFICSGTKGNLPELDEN